MNVLTQFNLFYFTTGRPITINFSTEFSNIQSKIMDHNDWTLVGQENTFAHGIFLMLLNISRQYLLINLGNAFTKIFQIEQKNH